jgi:glycogen operon protein
MSVFHLMVNAWREPLNFQLPRPKEMNGGSWRRWLDTSLASPADIVPFSDMPKVEGEYYLLPPHSLAVLIAGRLAGIR